MAQKNNLLTYIEVSAIFVAAIFCFRWIINPQGHFEPLIALCALIISSADLWRRHAARAIFGASPKLIDKPASDNMASQDNESVHEKLQPFPFASCCALFAHRFSQAFPGVREPTWFQGKNAVKRLEILLESPLRFSNPAGGEISPVWWFRSGNNSINNFRVLSSTSVLLDHQELNVRRICAVFSQNYKYLFVYLEADPSPPTGLYPRTPEEFTATNTEFGYVWEEYGLFKGNHLVTRAEYDDNSTLILGEVVPMHNECELRTRYVSSYNLVICGHDSPINNNSFDETLEDYMNRLLQGEDCMLDFQKLVLQLPARTYG